MDVPEATVRVDVPRALQSHLGGAEMCPSGLRLPGRSVRDVLAELARRHPQVYARICDERGEPRPHINVFVNADHVRARGGLDTALTTGDSVTILPAVSGG